MTMMTQEEYNKLLKYSLKFVKNFNTNDAEDIAQTACLLLLSNPPNKITNRLLFIAAKRASYRLYFKKDKDGNRVDRDDIFDGTLDADAPSDADLHNKVEANDFLNKILNSKTKDYSKNKLLLTSKEKMLLLKVIEGYIPDLADRTHYSNLRRKIKGLYEA